MCKTSKKESQPFVYDLRKVASYQNSKMCKYPRNYHDIVKSGKIKEGDTGYSRGTIKLLYGKADKNGMRNAYTLIPIVTYPDEKDVGCEKDVFYTLQISDKNIPVAELSKSYFEPFGFRRLEYEKYMPVFEIHKTEDPNEPYKLVNTHNLVQGECSFTANHEDDEKDRDEKGRNGKLLYTAVYDRHDTTFYVIRDQFGKLEIDSSIISLSFVLTASFLKLCGKVLTYLPMKLGECLLKKQNIIAKIFGNIFFTPFMPIKFLVNLAAVLVKIPVLLFVGDKKKYGNYYGTLWKHEFMECFNELKSDVSLIRNGKRPAAEDIMITDGKLFGTWKELNNARKIVKSWQEQV